VGLALPAQAEVAPSDATHRLDVYISGHITPHCSVVPRGATSLSFGSIMDSHTGEAVSGALDLPFSFECNTAYTASLISRHGGLAVQDGASAPGFSSLVDYSASLGLAHHDGDLSLDCDSAQMRSTGNYGDEPNSNCKTRSHGHEFSAGDGVVKLRLKAGGQPLLQGTYSDELLLLISPNIGG
jgi:hypothetical protein